MTNLTAVSLFAGIGGFELAMQRQGIEVVASVEIDKHASKLLQARFPLVKHFGDIKEVTGKELINAGFNPESGIITGGFPCQDLSIAGRRAGLVGERSGLFWEISRLLEETKSKYFILENVPGLLSSQRGRDMGIVISTLAQLGYGVGWRVLDAQYFGVPQRRRRVFIVGSLGDKRSPAEILFEHESLRRDTTQSNEKRKNTTFNSAKSFDQTSIVFHPHRHDGVRIQGETINTLTAYMGTGGNNMPMVVTKKVRRLTPVECERLQGFPDGWTAGQADTHRYKQIGNAVAVPVVEWIVERLVTYHG